MVQQTRSRNNHEVNGLPTLIFVADSSSTGNVIEPFFEEKLNVITFLLPDLRGGGVERIRLVLAHEFYKAGYEVEFVLMRAHGELLDEAKQCFHVVDLATPRARSVPFALASYLRKSRPRALIAAMWPLTAIAPVAARIANFQGKVLVSEHAILSIEYANWGLLQNFVLRMSTRIAYRLASARIGVSHGTCVDMSSLSNMDLGKFVTIHNPLRATTAQSKRDTEIAATFWGTNGPRILMVGNFKEVKNHALLLRSFATLNNSAARLMLVGEGGLEPDLRRLASELRISQQVIFAGFHPDPSPFYATADLFVLSSNHEGFGNVILEALSFGVPVVSTDCPSGPREILDNGKYGKLVAVGDCQALSNAINEALSTRHNPEVLKQRAAEFSPSIAAKKYLELVCP